jgi:hypothetical protein
MLKKKSKTKLVFSLKSSSVELSVIELGEIPKLLFYKKETLLYQKTLSPTEFISKSLTSVKKLLKENVFDITKTLQKSKTCEVILHSPWFLPEIISKENKGKEVGLKKFFMEQVPPPKQGDYYQLENKITNILLNGYHLTKLKDVPSSDIEINIFRSYASKKALAQIQKIIKDELRQIQKLSFSSATMEIYESLKNLFLNEDNFIYLNIGGEVTEIGIVENDVLVSTSTVPVGAHIFSRELDTFIGEKGDLSTLRFLSDKATDEKLDKIKKDKIEKIKQVWASKILESMQEHGKHLPRKMFVIANSDSVDFFKMIMKDCAECENFTFFNVTADVFLEKVENVGKASKENVEYLLSTYYLSIKS